MSFMGQLRLCSMPSSHGEQADQTAKPGRLTVVMVDEDRPLKDSRRLMNSLAQLKTDFAYHSHWLEPDVQPHLTTRGAERCTSNFSLR